MPFHWFLIKKKCVYFTFTPYFIGLSGFSVIIFLRAHYQGLESKKFLKQFLELKAPEI